MTRGLTTRRWWVLLLAAAAVYASAEAQGQAPQAPGQATQAQRHGTHGTASSQAKVVTETRAASTDQASKSAAGTMVDQVVAVVNGDLVLESDIDEDKRFEGFEPLRDASKPFDRDGEVERLINRTLIVEQARLQPDVGVTDAEVTGQITHLRQDIPACKQNQCDTDAGWARYVGDQGFTVTQLAALERRQMEVLRFIELRFRTGIRIAPTDVQSYYDNTLMPEYKRRSAPAPKVEVLSSRIEAILLEQRVSDLLNDWLVSLKAQGSVRIIRPGEVQP